jgi:hypothetical protein
MAAARAATRIAMVVGDSRKAEPWQDLDRSTYRSADRHTEALHNLAAHETG